MIAGIVLAVLAAACFAAIGILRHRGVFLWEVLPADGKYYDISITIDND